MSEPLGIGWLDPSEWHRDGRGRTWAFSLETATIVRSLESTAEALGDEFDLVACRRDAEGKGSRSIFVVKPCSALAFGREWQHFIRSRTISPSLPEMKPLTGVGWPAVFAVNGLIILDHPFPSKASPSGSSVGIVHRVRHNRTDEGLEHGSYDRVFKTLKRTLGSARDST